MSDRTAAATEPNPPSHPSSSGQHRIRIERRPPASTTECNSCRQGLLPERAGSPRYSMLPLTERRCLAVGRRTYKPFGCAFGARSGTARRPGLAGPGHCASIVVRLSRIRSSASTLQQAAGEFPRPATAKQLPNWPTLRDRGGHLRRGVRAGEGQGPFGLNSWPSLGPYARLDQTAQGEAGTRSPFTPGSDHRVQAACLRPVAGPRRRPPGLLVCPRHRGYRASQPKTRLFTGARLPGIGQAHHAERDEQCPIQRKSGRGIRNIRSAT